MTTTPPSLPTGSIILVEQDAVDQFPEAINRILNILGHPEALVTDESQVRDFFCLFGETPPTEEETEILAALSDMAGTPVTHCTLLWHIARDATALQQQKKKPTFQ